MHLSCSWRCCTCGVGDRLEDTSSYQLGGFFVQDRLTVVRHSAAPPSLDITTQSLPGSGVPTTLLCSSSCHSGPHFWALSSSSTVCAAAEGVFEKHSPRIELLDFCVGLLRLDLLQVRSDLSPTP